MSKWFSRAGTSAMKYHFELIPESLQMSIPLTTPMCVKWTRGPRTATNQPIEGKNGLYEWPQGKTPMAIVATLYNKNNKFQEKKSKITVKQLLGKELKSVGQVEIDLAEFCGQGEFAKRLQLKLAKCSDKKAVLTVTIKSRWLKELKPGEAGDDTASQMSGASVDARSESAMPENSQSRGDVGRLTDLDGMEDAHDDEHHDSSVGNNLAAPSSSTMSLKSPSSSNPFASNSAKSSPAGSAGHSRQPSTSVAAATPANEYLAELELLRRTVRELTDAADAGEEATKKVAALEAKVAQLKQENEELNADIDDLEKEQDARVVKLRTEMKNLQTENDALKADQSHATKELQQKLHDAQAEAETLRLRLVAQTEAAEKAREAAATSSGSAAAASTAETEAAVTARLNASFEKERAASDKQIKELRAELLHATKLTDDAFARMNVLEGRAATLKNEHETELAAKEREIERLETEVKDRAAAATRAADEAKAVQTQLADLRRSEKDLQAELASLQASFVNEMTRREALEKQVEVSEASMQDAKTAAKKAEMHAEQELKALKAQHLTDLAKLHQELAEARAAAASQPAIDAAALPEMATLQARSTELSLKLAATDEERLRLEKECIALEEALSKQKENELTILEERFEESQKMKKLLKEKEQEVDDSHKQVRELQRELKEAKAQLDKASKEAKETRKALDAAAVASEEMSAKVTKLTEDKAKGKQLVESSATRIRDLEAQLKEAIESKEEAERRVTERDEELTRASKKRSDLEAEFETEREALKRAAAEAAAVVEARESARIAALASSSAATEDTAAAELTHTRELLSKRTAEVAELESVLKELKARMRTLEAAEESLTQQLSRAKENESSLSKKLTEAQHEKSALEEDVSLLKEKREKLQEKLQEALEREKSHRLTSEKSSSESQANSAQVDQLLTKVEELEAALSDKTAKVSEQQDRLNSLTRTNESLTREHSEAREQLGIVQAKVDQLTMMVNGLQQRAESDRAATQMTIAGLEKQLADEHARRMVFDKLQGESLAALKKEKPAAALAEGLMAKIDFYEQQLADMDESLSMAKSSWLASSTVLAQQVDQLEKQLAQTKSDLHSALESKGLDTSRITSLESKVRKSEKDKAKLSEMLNKFEVELTQKKIELAAALDQLSTQQYENDKLRAQLSKQLQFAEQHAK